MCHWLKTAFIESETNKSILCIILYNKLPHDFVNKTGSLVFIVYAWKLKSLM